ncbi:MAG: D-alanyl-D-alanine carboxypeptidase DacB precursor [Pelotomaculum sp. PtaB.Bin104]|nr:MAG: D-alanyl-D-alanine carboxypeptidase DacB precursor [Pelotomaculum sp. PtaB.Bin104]
MAQRNIFKTGAALILALAFFVTAPCSALAATPRVTSSAAILVDAGTGQVYFGKNERVRSEPASLTKIMTAVLALENGNLSDVVTVGGRAAAVEDGSIIELRKGDKIVLGELLKAALICSANDSTVAIAEHVGGNYNQFITMMNTKAAVLGMFGTRYANTNGFHDPNHYTTAYDLAVLTRYALGHPKFNELVQTREATVNWTEPAKTMDVGNTNRLLRGGYEGVDGVKTGTTAAAGNCLIASATQDGRRLIAVALNANDRYRDCINMFDYGFKVVKLVTVIMAGQNAASLAVDGGVNAEVGAVAEKNLEVCLDPADINGLRQQLELPEQVTAPVEAGQKLGELAYVLRDREVGRVNLVAGASVPKKSWARQFLDRFF